MAIGTAAALIGSAIIGAGSSIYNSNRAANAAREAGRQQAAGIERGINESGDIYEQGQNYLSPYVESGATYARLLDDIIGTNGPEAQAAALQMYKSSPSASLLDAARAETIRRTDNQFAAGGGANSGARITELGRRTADLDLANYHQWQNLPMGMFNTGVNAAGAAAGLAGQRSGQVLGARSGQGTALASGTIGAANAQLAGFNTANNYLQYALRGSNDLSRGFQTANGPSYSPSSWPTTTSYPSSTGYSQSQMNQLNGYF